MNKCIFIGNVGKDPEVKHLTGDNVVANLSIACTEKWKDKTSGETKEKTEWIPVVAWGRHAELIEQYVTKGNKLMVEGKFETRSWDQDGTTRYKTEVRLTAMEFLGGKKVEPTPVSASGSTYEQQQHSNKDETDDLPF